MAAGRIGRAVAAALAPGVVVLPPVTAAAAPFRAVPVQPGTYAAVTVPRAVMTMAETVTDSGLAVGCFRRSTGPERGFIDRHGTFITIFDAAGKLTCPAGANDKGAVVGEYVSRSEVLHGFRYQNRTFTSVTDPHAGKKPGEGTVAVGINRAGVIVGWFVTAKLTVQGFVLKDGKYTTVIAPGAARGGDLGTALNGISDGGTMSGTYTDARGRQHGFLYRGGRFRLIEVPGARETFLACISEHGGVLVGSYRPRSGSGQAGFVDRNGVFGRLPAPGGGRAAVPQCGNDLGRVAGFLSGPHGHSTGFLFTPGKAAGRTAPIGTAPGRFPGAASPRRP